MLAERSISEELAWSPRAEGSLEPQPSLRSLWVPLCLCAQPLWGSNEDIRTFKQEPLVTEPVASGVTQGFGIWCLDKLPRDSAELPLYPLLGPTVWHWTLSSLSPITASPQVQLLCLPPSRPPSFLNKNHPHLSTEPSNPHPRWWSQTPSPLWSPDGCLSSYKLHVLEGETSGTLRLATTRRGVSALRPPWSPEVKGNACCLTRSGCLGTCISFFKKINNVFVGLLLL